MKQIIFKISKEIVSVEKQSTLKFNVWNGRPRQCARELSRVDWKPSVHKFDEKILHIVT